MRAAGVELAELKPEMRRASTKLGNALRQEVPRDSGRMASTIRESSSVRRAAVKIGREPVRYAYANVLNYSSKSRHRGFIERAVAKATPRVISGLSHDLNRIIRKHNL